MSKLDRMNLMGIRSFGPDEVDIQKIKFESPLTLIQGQNGCGKTTIIEAIKFAITGELPAGTDKGQGFVYDPKLSKQFESIGQVKLRISDAKGDLVTVMKVVRVLQKGPDKMEYKRLDATISRGKNSDPNQVSSRCADVDSEMCIVLGVSKPIINQVLFCHQEDSNWPLEEAKKLKGRFDQIFDAEKYNKCLDHISKKIKEKTEKFKIMKFEVSGLLDKKKYVDSKKLILHEKQDKFDLLTESILAVQATFEPINDKINELYQLEQNFAKLHTNIELKKKELVHVRQQQQDILKNAKEFNGTDEELNQKVNKFEDDLNSLTTDIEALKEKMQQIEDAEKDLLKKINNQQTKLGGLQSEEKQNNMKIIERNQLIQSTANDFDLNISIKEATGDTDVSRFINKLKSSFNAKKNGITNEQKRMDSEEDLVQTEIDTAREKNAQLNQNVSSIMKQLQELEDELRTIKQQLEDLNTADDQLKLAESKLQRIEREIKALESSVDTEVLKSQIQTDKQKLKLLQERCISVETDIKELQQYTNIQTELDVKNENFLSKQNDLKKLKNKHEKSLNHIFQNDVPTIHLKQAVESYHRTQSKSVREMNIKINDKQREVLKLENTLSSAQDKLNEKNTELTSNQEIIQKYCDEQPLEHVIKIINEKLDKMQQKRGVYFSSKYMYQKFIKNFQEEDPCCPLCKRRVQEKKYTLEIINDLKNKIDGFPSLIKSIDKEINKEQQTQQNLLTLKPRNEKIHKLKNDEIPAIEFQLQKNKEHFNKSSNELNKLKTDVSVIQKNEEIANLIMGDVSLIDQCLREITLLKQQIADLEKRMPNKSNSSCNRGIEEAMSERETLTIDIRSMQNNIESSQAKLSQHSERMHKLKEQKNTLIYQQLNIKKNLQDKDHLVTKSVETETKVSSLTLGLDELRTQIEPMKKQLSTSVKRKEEIKVVNRKKMDQLMLQVNTVQKKINEIIGLQTSIEEFKLINISDQINSVTSEIAKLKEEIEHYTKKKTQIGTTVDELKRQVTNSRVYYRELQDNVQLRSKRKEAEKIDKEISIEEQNLGKNDIRKIRNEKSKLVDEYETLRQQKHTSEGKKTTLQEDISALKKELAQPKNVKAAEEYKRKHLEYLLQDCSICDLKEFIKAMDWALMQYHKKRMVQINNIIKELWRIIYKGNDIDYIEIKTDDSKVQGKDSRKKYEYRVVQVKHQVELEMRGRCSAGQRVLASLIIRIALAETFSANCGILALDEPTTNLDRENINSLADALVDLIQQKRQQKNFQLLIITHDQDFVDRLNQMESLDKYYEVKRNSSGKSIIVVHNRY